jgi:acetyl esterase/lipase
MKHFSITLCLLLASCRLAPQTNAWPPSAEHPQVPIWPGPVPDVQAPPGPETMTVHTDHPIAGKPVTTVTNVSQPTFTVYSPRGNNTGAAVIVFPGGGYQLLAVDLEGTEICDWLNSKGITAVLLKYRVPIKWVGPYGESPQALEDAQRTLGLVRFHAAEWHIDPHKIGVIGFSAGGHMVAATSTHYDKRLYPPVDAADQESCRPDFAIALYPGHLWDNDPDDDKDEIRLNPNVPVTANTPPTFIAQATDDPVDNVNNSLVYYRALKKAKVPVEMHLFAKGGHAWGLRQTGIPATEWPGLVEKWLGTIGMIPH